MPPLPPFPDLESPSPPSPATTSAVALLHRPHFSPPPSPHQTQPSSSTIHGLPLPPFSLLGFRPSPFISSFPPTSTSSHLLPSIPLHHFPYSSLSSTSFPTQPTLHLRPSTTALSPPSGHLQPPLSTSTSSTSPPPSSPATPPIRPAPAPSPFFSGHPTTTAPPSPLLHDSPSFLLSSLLPFSLSLTLSSFFFSDLKDPSFSHLHLKLPCPQPLSHLRSTPPELSSHLSLHLLSALLGRLHPFLLPELSSPSLFPNFSLRALSSPVRPVFGFLCIYQCEVHLYFGMY